MEYTARKFSKESYNENDNYAKSRLTKHLILSGHTVLSDEEDFNHDLVTEKDGEVFYFEFEVKRNYPFTSEDDYRFDSVSFLGRKSRLHDINPYYYIIICYETDHAVYCHSSNIFKDDYKEQLTLKKRHRRGSDEMYRVPLEECGFFKLKI